MIKETNVTSMVGNTERSVRFYTESLGLKLKNRYGDDFATVEAPGTIITLHPISKNEPRQGNSENSISIGFSVDSLEKTMAELESKGVRFSKVTDDTQVRMVFFTDPEGYPLYLS
jgi:catechol 2,3-dioxygenase-like lactoylglutathione lyase family enzyme